MSKYTFFPETFMASWNLGCSFPIPASTRNLNPARRGYCILHLRKRQTCRQVGPASYEAWKDLKSLLPKRLRGLLLGTACATLSLEKVEGVSSTLETFCGRKWARNNSMDPEKVNCGMVPTKMIPEETGGKFSRNSSNWSPFCWLLRTTRLLPGEGVLDAARLACGLVAALQDMLKVQSALAVLGFICIFSTAKIARWCQALNQTGGFSSTIHCKGLGHRTIHQFE